MKLFDFGGLFALALMIGYVAKCVEPTVASWF